MSEILTDRLDNVLLITINRAAKKNAINTDMYIALNVALKAAVDDFGIRAVILTGSGGVFTAGNDIKDFAQNIPEDSSAPGFQFIKALHNFPKPLIAAVEGKAIGIGTTALLHCDLVFASDSAEFCMPFVTLGLVPEAGSSYLLPMRIGHNKAAEILLTGRTFSAGEALVMGIVNEIAINPLESALSAAKVISAQPPQAVINTKALMKSGHFSQVEAIMEVEGEMFRLALQSEEAQVAFAKFLGF